MIVYQQMWQKAMLTNVTSTVLITYGNKKWNEMIKCYIKWNVDFACLLNSDHITGYDCYCLLSLCKT